uniref:Uncharacterized protein n=1 Tax=Meleagris gallopavo TaxID=9103 RepID=G1MUD4_MELGA
MSSYFVNSLFSKYKTGDSLRPNYYDCGFAQDLGGRPTVVYGPSTGGTFQHPTQIQEFYHGASSLSSSPYQQNPCAVACHGDPSNFYGYDPLQRQSLFSAQESDLVQYTDCKLAASGLGEEAESSEQSPSPTQLFPWMRPQDALGSLRAAVGFFCVPASPGAGAVVVVRVIRSARVERFCWAARNGAHRHPPPSD